MPPSSSAISNTGREMELPTPDLLKTGLTFSADGRFLYFLGGREAEMDRTDIYVDQRERTAADRRRRRARSEERSVVDPAGAGAALHDSGPEPVAPAVGGRARWWRRGEGGRGGRGRTGRTGRDAAAAGERRRCGKSAADDSRSSRLKTRKVTVVNGAAPALSGDGKTLTYIARGDGPATISWRVRRPGCRRQSRRTVNRLDAPALSFDGSRIAFQQIVRDDWEIFVASSDGTSEQRITREIQHDLLPRFIGPNRLLAVIGEPRHRRSYLYDLGG